MISDIKNVIGIPVQENLETHYTRSQFLIENLMESRFSGFLVLEFWQYEGYLIFDTGNIIQGIELDRDKEREGLSAIINIYKKINTKEGSISTFKVNTEWIPLLLVSLKGKTLRTEKNLRENELKTFIENALDEIDYGIIRIRFGVNEAVAHILIMNGGIISTVLKDRDGKKTRESGTGRLFPIILKLSSTIQTWVSLESSDTIELYQSAVRVIEILDLIQYTELIVDLVQWMKGLLISNMPEKKIQSLFEQKWSESCESKDVKHIRILSDSFNGLDKISMTTMKEIFADFLIRIKPDIEQHISEDSLFEGLIRLFGYIKAEEFSELGQTEDIWPELVKIA